MSKRIIVYWTDGFNPPRMLDIQDFLDAIEDRQRGGDVEYTTTFVTNVVYEGKVVIIPKKIEEELSLDSDYNAIIIIKVAQIENQFSLASSYSANDIVKVLNTSNEMGLSASYEIDLYKPIGIEEEIGLVPVYTASNIALEYSSSITYTPDISTIKIPAVTASYSGTLELSPDISTTVI